jgi:hypothetical protein
MVRRTLLVLLVGMLLTGLSSLSYAQEGGAKPEKAAKGQPTKIEQALAKLT